MAGDSFNVVIGADADPLIKGLKDAEKALNSFGKSTEAIQGQLEAAAGAFETLLGVGISTGLAEMTRSAIDNVAALGEQANQVGLNVEKFQELKFAAQEAGVDQDDFTQGLNRLSKQLGEAQSGVQKSQEVFEKWGIVLKDSNGNSLGLEATLLEIAKRMQSITDPALRSAFAFDVLGKNSFNLINFLSNGAEAMQDAEEKARSMGAVIGEDTVKKAEDCRKKLAELATVISTNLEGAIVDLLPSAQKLEDFFDAVSRGAEGFYKLYKNQITSLLNGGGDPREAYEQTVQQMIDEQIDKAKQNNSIPKITITKPSQSGNETVNVKGQEALNEYINKLQDLHEVMGLSARDQQIQKALDDAEAIARKNNIALSQDQIQEIQDLAAANYNLKQQIDLANSAADGLSSAFSSAFQQATTSGNKFSDVLKNLEQQIADLIFKLGVEGPLQDALRSAFGGTPSGGGGGIGGLLGNLFGGGGSSGPDESSGLPFDDLISNLTGKAAGGPVAGGTPYIVGEQGPELFVPRASGSIVPNGQAGGGGVTIVQNLNFSTGVQATVRAEVMNMMPQIAAASTAAVADAKRRGGSFARAFKN